MSGHTKERGLTLDALTVRGIRLGRKHQFRRVALPQPAGERAEPLPDGWGFDMVTGPAPLSGGGMRPLQMHGTIRCPYGAPGDRLWARETWAAVVPGGNGSEITGPPRSFPPIWQKPYVCRYRADPDPLADADAEVRGYRWRSPRTMPRWASRVLLELVEVRLERLQSISERDARAEGVIAPLRYVGAFRDAFAKSWDVLNMVPAHSWAMNPWVWAVEFKVIEEQG